MLWKRARTRLYSIRNGIYVKLVLLTIGKLQDYYEKKEVAEMIEMLNRKEEFITHFRSPCIYTIEILTSHTISSHIRRSIP